MNPPPPAPGRSTKPNSQGMGTWDGIAMRDRSSGPDKLLFQLHVDLPVSQAMAAQFSNGLLQPDYDAVSTVLDLLSRETGLPYLSELNVAWTPPTGPAGVPALGIWSLGVEERIIKGAQTWFVVLRATIDLENVTNAHQQSYGGPALFASLVQPATMVSDPAAQATLDIAEWVQREVQAGSKEYPCVAEILALFYFVPAK